MSSSEYRMLLGPYSDHIATEESIREAFFDAVGETICRHAGTVLISDTIVEKRLISRAG